MIEKSQTKQTTNSNSDDSNVLNIIFVSTYWGRGFLTALAKSYGQEQNYCFLCSCEYPKINYEVYEKFFHLVKSHRRFRLIYLLETIELENPKQREEHVDKELSVFNQNNQHFPIVRLFIKDIEVYKTNLSYGEQELSFIREIEDLIFCDNKYYVYEEDIEDINDYPNAIQFWEPFHQKIQSYPSFINDNLLLEKDSSITYVVLVDNYEASYYWTKLYEEFGSPNQYLFIPGMGSEYRIDNEAFDETLGLFEKFLPLNNVKFFAFFNGDQENQHCYYWSMYYSHFKGFNNKGRKCKLVRVYNYKSLNLSPIEFAFNGNKISIGLSTTPDLGTLYLASHWKLPNLPLNYLGWTPNYPKETDFPYDEAHSQEIRKYIWDRFVKLIEQR